MYGEAVIVIPDAIIEPLISSIISRVIGYCGSRVIPERFLTENSHVIPVPSVTGIREVTRPPTNEVPTRYSSVIRITKGSDCVTKLAPEDVAGISMRARRVTLHVFHHHMREKSAPLSVILVLL